MVSTRIPLALPKILDTLEENDRQTNTRVYYQTELITTVKSFIVQAFQRKSENFYLKFLHFYLKIKIEFKFRLINVLLRNPHLNQIRSFSGFLTSPKNYFHIN
jgi:hypothetical protein